MSDVFVPVERAQAPAGDLAGLLGRAAPAAPASTTDAHLVQPAIFVAEYALARQLVRWGLKPEIMIGYSLGEYVAACLAGVLSLPDALRLVAYRAKLITSQPEGAMLAISADERRLRVVLGEPIMRDLDVAVRTGSQVVLAGPAEIVESAAALLLEARIGHRRLETTHAFHSRMLAPVAEELTTWVKNNVTPRPPELPYLSNVTGELATAELVGDPGYWARHMCETVEFGAGLGHVLGIADLALAEIGPGQSLGALTRGHPGCDRAQWPLIVTTLPAANDPQDADAALATAVGKLWLTGVPVDWPALHDDPGWTPGRVPLPTYPFEHQEYWLEIDESALGSGTPAFDESDPTSIAKAYPRLPDTRWIHLPTWRQTTLRPARADEADPLAGLHRHRVRRHAGRAAADPSGRRRARGRAGPARRGLRERPRRLPAAAGLGGRHPGGAARAGRPRLVPRAGRPPVDGGRRAAAPGGPADRGVPAPWPARAGGAGPRRRRPRAARLVAGHRHGRQPSGAPRRGGARRARHPARPDPADPGGVPEGEDPADRPRHARRRRALGAAGRAAGRPRATRSSRCAAATAGSPTTRRWTPR